MRKYWACAVLLAAIVAMLTGCSNSKSNKEIAKEIATVDSYFINYDLTLDDYDVEKRQTNDGDKTDYVWLSISGSNDEFRYTANYEIVYIKYNDGWHLENYTVTGTNYYAKSAPDIDSIITELSKEFSNVEYISTGEGHGSNSRSYNFTGENEDGSITEMLNISVDYEYSPTLGWHITNQTKSIVSYDYNFMGEWLYKDDTHIYYISVSEINQGEATLEYAFLNKDIFSADAGWRLREADYMNYSICQFSGNEIYLDVGWEKAHNSISFADENYIWFCNHDVTVGGIVDNGIVVNGFFLDKISDNTTDSNYPKELKNAIEESVIDYAKIPKELFDSTLISYLEYFHTTYGDLGLNPGKSSNVAQTRYPLPKAGFLGNQVFVYLWFNDEITDDSIPNTIELAAVGMTFDALKEKIENTLETEMYEKSLNSFVVLIPYTDILIRVQQSTLTVEVYITRMS